jgi:hypothetical protein
MKNQNLASVLENSWNGIITSPGQFVPLSHKHAPAPMSASVDKKSELEKRKSKKTPEKTTKLGRPDAITSTQHLDHCFSSMWRRCT